MLRARLDARAGPAHRGSPRPACGEGRDSRRARLRGTTTLMAELAAIEERLGGTLEPVRAAAIQLEARVADVDANLESAERLVDRAAAEGAGCIALPEFFTTGIGFVPELADRALAPDGEASRAAPLPCTPAMARCVGGSFLCRDEDGEVRNAFLLADPGGELAGRHDKDLPTMWENAFYVGGNDDGVIDAGELTIGAALCWELMRTQTVRRLRGGSIWRSPVRAGGACRRTGRRAAFRSEAANHRRAVRAAAGVLRSLHRGAGDPRRPRRELSCRDAVVPPPLPRRLRGRTPRRRRRRPDSRSCDRPIGGEGVASPRSRPRDRAPASAPRALLASPARRGGRLRLDLPAAPRPSLVPPPRRRPPRQAGPAARAQSPSCPRARPSRLPRGWKRRLSGTISAAYARRDLERRENS